MATANKSRIQLLRDAVKAAQKADKASTADIPFRGAYLPCVKVKVRADFPMYRIQNGRTHKKQMAYLRAHPGLGKNFFDDPEDARVQAAQQEILLELIDDMALSEDLKEKKQRTPIVLTYDGFIVDGNRRVAALRKQKEAFVIAVVLPEDADRLDIFETEFELQLVRDTKAEYDWLDELIHLKYGVDELKGQLNDFARRKRMAVDLLKAEMAKLQVVDMYLAWLGEPGAYDRIPDEARGGSMQQVFTDLSDRLRSKAVTRLSKNSRDTIMHACFAAIKNQEGYQTVRNIITQLTRNADRIVENMSRDAEVSKKLKAPNRPKKPASTAGLSDPLSELADAEVAGTPDAYHKLNSVVQTPAAAETVITSLVTAANNMEDEDRDSKKQAIYLIEQAEAKLSKVDISPRDDLDVIARALARVDEHLTRLTDVITTLKKDAAPSKKGKK